MDKSLLARLLKQGAALTSKFLCLEGLIALSLILLALSHTILSSDNTELDVTTIVLIVLDIVGVIVYVFTTLLTSQWIELSRKPLSEFYSLNSSVGSFRELRLSMNATQWSNAVIFLGIIVFLVSRSSKIFSVVFLCISILSFLVSMVAKIMVWINVRELNAIFFGIKLNFFGYLFPSKEDREAISTLVSDSIDNVLASNSKN